MLEQWGFTRDAFGEFSVLWRGRAGVPVHWAHATGFNAAAYLPLLATFDPSLEVCAMDARGHGMSQAQAEPRKLGSWKVYRRDLARFLRSLGRPAVLAGHSLGATVSLELAAEHPDLVLGLLLVEPPLVDPQLRLQATIAKRLGLSARLPIARGAAARRAEFPSREAAIENYLGRGVFKSWPREFVEAYVDGGTVETASGSVRLSCEPAWESRTFAKWSTHPYRAIERLRCPVTLMSGARDERPLGPKAIAKFVELCPEARVVSVPDAGHLLPMERPDLVRHELDALLARVKTSQL
jgi:pimeloyl-ACP methyl ester carboxylesterase